MTTGLPVSDIVDVDIIVAPNAAPRRSFGKLLIAGNSDVIDVTTRVRAFSSAAEVAAEFGSNAPEYLAALLFFSQLPTPNEVLIGRWARTATKGTLFGDPRSAAEQALSVFTAITSGGFAITIDGTVRTLSSINLSAVTSLAGVAASIQTALSTWATCSWNATQRRFEIRSTTTGAGSTLAAVSSTPLSTALGITAAVGARIIQGVAAETPAEALDVFQDLPQDWYGLLFADTNVTNDQHLAIAAAIEATVPSRIYGATTQEAGALDATSTSDLAYMLKAGNFRRSFCQYSAASPYAAASIFGRAFTVDFTGANTTITLKFKNEPGVTAELLLTSQARALTAKHCNYFVAYENGTAILQEGVMADGTFFDEVHGLDWLQNAVQTDLFNMLYQSPTKIPQTEAGITTLQSGIEKTLGQAVTNGLLAPGYWTAQGFGKIEMGDYLPKGFYVYSTPLVSQAQADREARKAPPFQVAAKMAGAVHFVNVSLNINR